jgi:hypothetical protein
VVEADVVQRAADAKLAMWPPSSPGLRLARTTIAIAFQRMIERMRHSSALSENKKSPAEAGPNQSGETRRGEFP